MKKYNKFEVGDEVQTSKFFKAITSSKTYEVVSFYTPPGLIEGSEIRVIEIVNDLGFISRYSSNRFSKTDRQKRDDKIKEIMN